jgi:trans-aconitate 2-methyltransferase
MNKCYVLCCVFIFQIVCGAETNKNQWNAKEYKENASPQWHFAQYALSQIPFKSNDIVLDVGCGDGKITFDIAQNRVPQGCVTGIDSSASMIDLANHDFLEIPNLLFQRTDATQYHQYNDRSGGIFTKAVVLCSLSWMKDQAKAYKNIANALVQGGTFMALVSDHDSSILQAYRKAFTHTRWESYFTNYTPAYYPSTQEQIHTYLNNAGLTSSVTVKKADIPPMMLAKEVLLKALGATPGVKDAIPAEHYQDFLNDVVREYLRLVPADKKTGNMIIVDSGLILVIAKKPEKS